MTFFAVTYFSIGLALVAQSLIRERLSVGRWKSVGVAGGAESCPKAEPAAAVATSRAQISLFIGSFFPRLG